MEGAGFNLEKNWRILQGADGHYIIGEKMRLGRTVKPAEALTRRGRYQTLDNGLKFKEVIISGDSESRRRFIVDVSLISGPPRYTKRCWGYLLRIN